MNVTVTFVGNVDVSVLVNACRVVGHVDDDVRRIAEIGQAAVIQRAIVPTAAGVDLRLREAAAREQNCHRFENLHNFPSADFGLF